MYSSEPYPTAPSPVQISQRSRVPGLGALAAIVAAGLTLLVLVLALGIGSNTASLPQRRDMAPPAAKVATTSAQPAARLTPLVQHYLAQQHYVVPQRGVKLGR